MADAWCLNYEPDYVIVAVYKDMVNHRLNMTVSGAETVRRDYAAVCKY